MEVNVDRIAGFFHVKHPSPLEIRNNLGMYLILEARPTEHLFRHGCTSMPWLKKCLGALCSHRKK